MSVFRPKHNISFFSIVSSPHKDKVYIPGYPPPTLSRWLLLSVLRMPSRGKQTVECLYTFLTSWEAVKEGEQSSSIVPVETTFERFSQSLKFSGQHSRHKATPSQFLFSSLLVALWTKSEKNCVRILPRVSSVPVVTVMDMG